MTNLDLFGDGSLLKLVHDADMTRADRDRYGNRTDVLDRVKALRLLPDGLHLTTDLVANYYEVGTDVITKLAQRHRDELEANGYRLLTGQELVDMKSTSGLASRAPQLAVFDRRALVRVGLLLRDSDVARRVRDAVQDGYESESAPDLSDPLLALQRVSSQLSQAVTLALAERNRAEAAEASVKALLPAANAWETFRATGATLSVSAAAKYLVQRHGVNTGRNKLYNTLRALDWVFKRTCEPKGEAVKAGLVEVEAGSKFTVEKTGEQRNGSPRTRLTADGLIRLAEHFGVVLDTDALASFIAEENLEVVP